MPMMDAADLTARIEQEAQVLDRIVAEVGKVIVGQREVIRKGMINRCCCRAWV